MPCSCCDITGRLTSTFWSFWWNAAERLSSILIATVVIGGLASAYYFDVESRRMEEELKEIADAHQEAEMENYRLRKRTLSLWKERSRVTEQVARIEAANARTDAQVRRLKHKDSLSRAEMSALCGDLKNLRRSLACACHQRDLYKGQLEYCLSAKHRPVTQ